MPAIACAKLGLTLLGVGLAAWAPRISGAEVASRPSAVESYARVPGGEFRSVLPEGVAAAASPIEPFALQRIPVTNGDYLDFVRTHPEWQRGRVPGTLADSHYLQHWAGPLELGSQAHADQPVTKVSWFAARAYCESQQARLPRWVEWEFAAAADEQVADARHDPMWRQRILATLSRSPGSPLPAVGLKAANLYGVHDLAWRRVGMGGRLRFAVCTTRAVRARGDANEPRRHRHVVRRGSPFGQRPGKLSDDLAARGAGLPEPKLHHRGPGLSLRTPDQPSFRSSHRIRTLISQQYANTGRASTPGVTSMSIVHIERPADLDPSAFDLFQPPPVGDLPRPTLGTAEAWAAPDGAIETGTWEATPGSFVRAVVDAEFCHFVRGRATFITDDGRRLEFKAGDAAYFPPRTGGTWTIHETLRKTYCIWR